MLQIRNLTITHLKDLKELVKDLSLTVNQGDKVAIIGEEGNGKSTLLKTSDWSAPMSATADKLISPILLLSTCPSNCLQRMPN